jgi:hypothetical protein
MSRAKIIFQNGEFELKDGISTLGRTSDNDIAFPNDSNVSRFHAEIEKRDQDYCLIELGSSNGTTINGTRVTGETYLKEGDKIVLGGSTELTFSTAAETAASEAEAAPTAQAPVDEASGAGAGIDVSSHLGTATPQVSSLAYGATADVAGGSHTMLYIAGGACLVAVLFVGAAAAVYLLSGSSSCDAKAKIVSPEAGETIIEPTDVDVQVTGGSCVAQVVFTIDGERFAEATDEPFTAKLDPKDFPDLADGLDHNLGVVLFDAGGKEIGSPVPIALAFETRAIAKPATPEPEVAQTNTKAGQPGPKQVSLIDVQDMSKRLLKQFSGNFAYNVSNKQFLQEVQKMTAEYAQPGYYERAAKYRDAINLAYVREQNLDASLGFILAMSRSKFNAEKQGEAEGLWRMSSAFVAANGYNGLCGTETLSDASQNCAAKASALYMKAIVYGVFGGDAIYSAVAFGKSSSDAEQWKGSLPPNRADIWNSVRTPAERDQLVRFFAAGIVSENPAKFGLTKDRPLSELYRLTQ